MRQSQCIEGEGEWKKEVAMVLDLSGDPHSISGVGIWRYGPVSMKDHFLRALLLSHFDSRMSQGDSVM